MQQLKHPRNHFGIGVAEVALVVVIIGLVGFTAYYTLHSASKTNGTLDAANNTSAAPVKRKKSMATPAANLQTAADAANPNDTQSTNDLSDAANALNY